MVMSEARTLCEPSVNDPRIVAAEFQLRLDTVYSFSSYMTDTYLMYTGSAFAVNMVFRCAFGAAFPLFTTAMFDGVGVSWACTLLGLVSLLLCPIPVVFFKFGARMRGEGFFTPVFDLKMAERLKEMDVEITLNV